MATRIFGIRHHGPGSAKKLEQALHDMEPDIVLIEGPPEGTDLLYLAAAEDMVPPVALLVYRPDYFEQAAFYPFANYSPEWRAIRYAVERNIPVRFIDLPMAWQWKQKEAQEYPVDKSVDPMAEIARIAGYDDGEKWWEEVVEQRFANEDVFDGILQLMGAIRESASQLKDRYNEQREAYMRQSIRKAEREMYADIAVVCGAFHAPALENRPTAKIDRETLQGMRGVKTASTWIPWTYERLSQQSGYGAGVASPTWYDLVFESGSENLTATWMARAAHAFRDEGQDISPGHVVEGVRLAETLAAIRGKEMPGLEEFTESVQAVFCFGDARPLELIHRKLVIGDRLGSVPAEAPAMPLQRDIEKRQKKLRLSPGPETVHLKLDLRKPKHLEKSHFLHRMVLLRIPWGEQELVTGKSGTFHEQWILQWQPECDLRVLEASTWGNTVESACGNLVRQELKKDLTLAELTSLLGQVFLAELPELVLPLTEILEERVALGVEVNHLMEALPTLVNALRYGSVRGVDGEAVRHVLGALVPRIMIGLPGITRNIRDDYAEELYTRITGVNAGLRLLNDETFNNDWMKCLEKVAGNSGAVHGKIWGVSARLLFDAGVWDSTEAAKHMGRALSPASGHAKAAAWTEGFLHGSGLLLIHNAALFEVIDTWLAGMKEEVFMESLPVLRRTFARFTAPERKQIGELARTGNAQGDLEEPEDWNLDRAATGLETIFRILGVEKPQTA